MDDDRIATKDGSAREADSLSATDASPESDTRGPVFLPTRRDFLAGGVSSVLAESALAAAGSPFLDVGYEDRTRRGLVVAWIDPAVPKPASAWTLRASTFTDPDLPNGRGRFVLRRTEDGWRADIAQCALPGGYEYALRLDFIWNPAQNPKKVQPSVQMTLRRNTDVRLTHDNLIDFLKADESNPEEIAGRLTKSQVATLTQTLFGHTFDTTKASDVWLAFRRESYWVLRAGEKLTRGETESVAARQNRFRALADEGISLQFREVFFTTFSSTTGEDLSRVFTLNPGAKPQDRQDVRALFAGDGAPPAPDDTLSEPGVGATNAVSAKSKAMDARETATSAAEKRRLAQRVLYALVRHDPIQTKANPPDAWNGTLALGRHSGGERASLIIHDGAPRHGAPDDQAASFLGWRNQGDDNPIFALRAPWMVFNVKRDATASPTEFHDLSGLLWRGRGEDNSLRIIASLTPTRRRMFVETRFGRFTVAPLPPIAPRSGVSARVPPIRVGGTGARNERTLNHLAAPAALEEAAIPLASERLAERERRRAAAVRTTPQARQPNGRDGCSAS